MVVLQVPHILLDVTLNSSIAVPCRARGASNIMFNWLGLAWLQLSSDICFCFITLTGDKYTFTATSLYLEQTGRC